MPNALYDALFEQHRGSSRTYIFKPDGASITYSDFLAMAARTAHALRSCGVEPGDRVAVQIAKSPEALALYIASVQAGAVFLPLNTAYTPSEIEYFVENAGPKLVVCDPASVDALASIAAAAGAALKTLAGDGSGSLTDLAKDQPTSFPTVDRGPDDLAAFLYTSGTTGRSKGAMLTHDNLLSNAVSLVDAWRFTGDDILLHALPIFHTHGLFVAANTLTLAGGAMIWLPGFQIDAVIENLPQATSMMGVPTFYTRLLDDPCFTQDLVSHMRLFTSGSAPLLAETHVAFEERTGHRILERYGMTETNMNTSNPYDGERRAGTVGFPLPGVSLRICDPETAEELPQGDIGVIEVKGPNVFKGYWRMPEKTKEEFRDDGFFITGDLALIDEDGYVHIVGRARDLIISGGYNIYPKEVELLLDEQQGVLESAVIGVPHPDFGEAVVAAVVPQKGAAVEETDILEAIHDKIARFKQPKRIHIVPELPRNTMGKVQKNLLRDQFGKDFSA
ncbi:MAG: malonyl-CoA synthase [Rhizobiaceae bacterium MnEN-MB40S]|nr:MAG: malonyl-CoA synthase [Rhizobiaceae bacterium MnEN-MB40S]